MPRHRRWILTRSRFTAPGYDSWVLRADVDLPERLRPLAWMIGHWEGAGVVGYPTIDSANFGQEVVVSS